MLMIDMKKYYAGKKVFVTGHTGFKGSWLCLLLNILGAEVVGYSLEPNTTPSLYELIGFKEEEVHSYIGDVRDFYHLHKVMQDEKPEYVIHLAAQPIVRESYKLPRETFETNVMGTVNLLESIRRCDSVKSVLNVTTDKVYMNVEKDDGYAEEDVLDGYDPYSNSKSCSELVTHSYVRSFFDEKRVPVSTARAGNVIGGGDFEKDRIIPDCVRATLGNKKIMLRNPNSVRPYQHVLEALYVYLMILAKQTDDYSYQGAYNVGPEEKNIVMTRDLVRLFCEKWNDPELEILYSDENGPHEAGKLYLNCDKVKKVLGWKQKWNIEKTIESIVEWSKCYVSGSEIRQCMERQIGEYMGQK